MVRDDIIITDDGDQWYNHGKMAIADDNTLIPPNEWVFFFDTLD
jgi:hypothetical protein